MSVDNAARVGILSEALGYVRRYCGKTVVIKYGGNAMRDAELETAFAEDIIRLKLVGIHPVIVHGGGPQITRHLAKLGKQSRFINGLRYTDADTMQIVEMVLGGLVNKHLVSLINAGGGRAVGLTGKDGKLLTARRTQARAADGAPIDIGLVGDIVGINTQILTVLEDARFIPVIAPIGADENGVTLNINADTAAAELAVALGAQALFLLTNTGGVLDQNGAPLSTLSAAAARQLIADGVIAGGMRPKVECGIRAVTGGVSSCQIINGELRHAVLLELFTDEGAGTFISL